MSLSVLPIDQRILKYIQPRGISKVFYKQLSLLMQNPKYPSLRTELMLPKARGLYSFRVTLKYRAIFVYKDTNTIEIIDVNDHYQ